MKEVEKTKSNVSAIAWTPSATSRPICRWLKPQTNMPSWKKRKPRWKQKLLACVRFIAKNWVKKHKNWWRCRFSAQLPKRAGWYGQAEEKCSRTGGCAPNDRTGPWNGPGRDDRVFKDRVLSPQTTGTIVSTRIWLALAGQCGDSPVYSPNDQTIHSPYVDLPLVDILKMHLYRNNHL